MENKKITSLEVKGVNEQDFTVEALVSNSKLDGDNEIILDKAWKNFDRYKKNPVLMSSHDVWSLNKIIGKCDEIKKTPEGVICKFEYFVGEGNEEADWAFVLAKKGIAAFSVGFIAHGYEWDEEKVKEILKEEGIKVGKGRRVRGIITEAELYEVSQVNVPANADALMKSKTLSKSLSIFGDDYRDSIISAFEEMENDIKAIYDRIEIKRVVPYKSYPSIDEESWDASKEVKAVRSWAGFEDDGEGSWSKYSRAFTYVESGEEEKFGGYKFPHHAVRDGELKTHRQGVFAAMQRLSSGDVSDEDRKKMYNHLAKHYTNDLGEEPPEFKSLTENDENKTKGEEVITMNVDLKELVALAVTKAVEEIAKSFDEKLEEIKSGLPEAPGIDYNEVIGEIKSLKEDNEKIKTLITDFQEKFVKIKEDEEKTKSELEKEDKNNDLYSKLLTTIDNFDFTKKKEKEEE